jgi:hypothetical protein
MTSPATHEKSASGPGAWLRSYRAVAWAFLGIRKGSESQHDFSQIKPVTVVVVGISSALLLVLFLVGLVNWVIAAQ